MMYTVESNVCWKQVETIFDKDKQRYGIVGSVNPVQDKFIGIIQDGRVGFPLSAQKQFNDYWDKHVPQALSLLKKIQAFVSKHPEGKTIANISSLWPMLYSAPSTVDFDDWGFCWEVEFVHGANTTPKDWKSTLHIFNHKDVIHVRERFNAGHQYPTHREQSCFSFLYDENASLPKELTRALLFYCV